MPRDSFRIQSNPKNLRRAAPTCVPPAEIPGLGVGMIWLWLSWEGRGSGGDSVWWRRSSSALLPHKNVLFPFFLPFLSHGCGRSAISPQNKGTCGRFWSPGAEQAVNLFLPSPGRWWGWWSHCWWCPSTTSCIPPEEFLGKKAYFSLTKHKTTALRVLAAGGSLLLVVCDHLSHKFWARFALIHLTLVCHVLSPGFNLFILLSGVCLIPVSTKPLSGWRCLVREALLEASTAWPEQTVSWRSGVSPRLFWITFGVWAYSEGRKMDGAKKKGAKLLGFS